MRIATAQPRAARRHRFVAADPRQQRLARLESLAMVVVSLAIATGVWLSLTRQAESVSAASGELATGTIGRLGHVPTGSLAALLTVFPTAAERRFAADAVDRFIVEHGPPTHVGALAGIDVPAQTVSANPTLTTLRDRLERRPQADAVPLFTAADIVALKPRLVVRTPGEFTQHLWTALGLFLLACWLTHLVRRLLGTTGDAVLLPSVQLLTGLGLIAMISLRDPLRDTESAVSVAIGAALACGVLTALSLVDFESPRFRFATWPPLGAALGLAAALLAFGDGPSGSGATVNLWGAQPIELIRLLAVFALAAYFSRRWDSVRLLSDARLSTRVTPVPRWTDISPLVVIVGSLLIFFFLQRDLGPALVLGCMSLALYGMARGRAGLVLAGLGVLAAGFALGYEAGIPATVARRVAIWLDPWENALRGGDQVAHGLWALASGGVGGLGLGIGDGRFVPAAHTDLIVAALGEEIGLIGLLAVAAVYVLMVGRMLYVAARAPGDYTAFLAVGCALSVAVPALVIVGGVFGAFPLTGVVTPFLSFGKSAMLCNAAAVGIVLAIARRAGHLRPQIAGQVRTVKRVLVVVAALLIADAVRIQAWQADTLAVRPTLIEQGDGVARYQYNPRLLNAARLIPRGTIFDRNGRALATGDPALAATMRTHLNAAGLSASPCPVPPGRCYPLGGAAFHLIGDWNDRLNWNAPNVSFLEQDDNAVLQGFGDYQDLLPLVRHKGHPDHPAARRILSTSRDLTTSIDGVFQALVARALEKGVRAAGVHRGAVVVIDPDTGELLASASVPYPVLDAGPARPAAATPLPALLDRARYGLFPPGSTFKLITAAAALRSHDQSTAFACRRLPDGRVGARVPGYTHPVRDDIRDHAPHGQLNLHDGLVVSCNAYFAQLAVRLGPQAILDAAAPTGIQVAREPVMTHLRQTLPYAGYGQGEVLATPLRMARVVGAIATDGVIRETVTRRQRPQSTGTPAGSKDVRWLTPEQASSLAVTLRDVVVKGTGRVLAGERVAIAGKTGTAEVHGAASHAWFVGFAPYATRGRRIALAIVVENAGYGGRVAAPLAGEVVSAARIAGLIK